MELFFPTLLAIVIVFPLSIAWTLFGVIKILPLVDRFASKPEHRIARFVLKPIAFFGFVPAPIILPIGFVLMCVSTYPGLEQTQQQKVVCKEKHLQKHVVFGPEHLQLHKHPWQRINDNTRLMQWLKPLTFLRDFIQTWD